MSLVYCFSNYLTQAVYSPCKTGCVQIFGIWLAKKPNVFRIAEENPLEIDKMIDEDGTKGEEKEEKEGGDKEEEDLGSDEKDMETEQVCGTPFSFILPRPLEHLWLSSVDKFFAVVEL